MGWQRTTPRNPRSAALSAAPEPCQTVVCRAFCLETRPSSTCPPACFSSARSWLQGTAGSGDAFPPRRQRGSLNEASLSLLAPARGPLYENEDGQAHLLRCRHHIASVPWGGSVSSSGVLASGLPFSFSSFFLFSLFRLLPSFPIHPHSRAFSITALLASSYCWMVFVSGSPRSISPAIDWTIVFHTAKSPLIFFAARRTMNRENLLFSGSILLPCLHLVVAIFNMQAVFVKRPEQAGQRGNRS